MVLILRFTICMRPKLGEGEQYDEPDTLGILPISARGTVRIYNYIPLARVPRVSYWMPAGITRSY